MKVIVESCGTSQADEFFMMVRRHIISVLGESEWKGMLTSDHLVFKCRVPKDCDDVDRIVLHYSFPKVGEGLGFMKAVYESLRELRRIVKLEGHITLPTS